MCAAPRNCLHLEKTSVSILRAGAGRKLWRPILLQALGCLLRMLGRELPRGNVERVCQKTFALRLLIFEKSKIYLLVENQEKGGGTKYLAIDLQLNLAIFKIWGVPSPR